MKILLLTSSADAPVTARRVRMLQAGGHRVTVMGWERRLEHGSRIPDARILAAQLPNGRYAQRLLRWAADLPRIRRAARRHDFLYVQNADCAILLLPLALTGLSPPFALETTDILPVQTERSLRGRVVRRLLRRSAATAAVLVLTSPEYRQYFRCWLRVSTPALVVENKIPDEICDTLAAARERAAAAIATSADRPGRDRPFRIGWCGMLRDEWSLTVLERLLARRPQQFQAVLRGVLVGLEQAPRRIAALSGLTYEGPYRYPDDLPDVYGGVDLALACYPPEPPLGWARSERWYHAAMMRIPILCRAGCGDAGPVVRHDIGMALSASDPDLAAAELAALTPADWQRWRDNLAALPEAEYRATADTARLNHAIASAAGSRPA